MLHHYRRSTLCRVPGAHGKALKTHGKGFAVGSTRHNTHDILCIGKKDFTVCISSHTRQTINRVPTFTLGTKKKRLTATDALSCAKRQEHTTKAHCLPCAKSRAHDKHATFCRVPGGITHGKNGDFAVFHDLGTRQSLHPGLPTLPCAMVMAHGKACVPCSQKIKISCPRSQKTHNITILITISQFSSQQASNIIACIQIASLNIDNTNISQSPSPEVHKHMCSSQS